MLATIAHAIRRAIVTAVARVARLVDLSEYKRRQAPPGVRVSPKAFGKCLKWSTWSGPHAVTG